MKYFLLVLFVDICIIMSYLGISAELLLRGFAFHDSLASTICRLRDIVALAEVISGLPIVNLEVIAKQAISFLDTFLYLFWYQFLLHLVADQVLKELRCKILRFIAVNVNAVEHIRLSLRLRRQRISIL